MHGYDTKYAMHALRLGIQGVELLSTGRITLPVPEPSRAYLRSVRHGEVPLTEVVAAIDQAEADLERLGPARLSRPNRTAPGWTTGSTGLTPLTGPRSGSAWLSAAAHSNENEI